MTLFRYINSPLICGTFVIRARFCGFEPGSFWNRAGTNGPPPDAESEMCKIIRHCLGRRETRAPTKQWQKSHVRHDDAKESESCPNYPYHLPTAGATGREGVIFRRFEIRSGIEKCIIRPYTCKLSITSSSLRSISWCHESSSSTLNPWPWTCLRCL